MLSQWSRFARLLGVFAATGLLAMVVGAAASAPAEIEVVLQDGSIQMSDSTAAGNAVFVIRNDSEVAHAFAIRTKTAEPREVAALESNVEPGESARLQAVLAPGTYVALCTLADHENHRISHQLVVIEETQ